jgi:hypothetical protein
MDQYKQRLELIKEETEAEIKKTEQAIDILKNDPESAKVISEWEEDIVQGEFELELIDILKECNSQEEIDHIRKIFDNIVKNGGQL